MQTKYYLTSENPRKYLEQEPALELEDAPSGPFPQVQVFPDSTFQEILGFGGAFTEAAADALARLSPENRAKAIEAYFHPEHGIGYTFCRTHMNSCDFSTGNYACVETEDPSLESFTLQREEQLLLPLILDSMAAMGSDRSLRLFFSPWSPPAWMKTTGEMNNGGQLKPEYREAWANYYIKFYQALEKAGVPVWGLSVQNEPAAKQTWDSCLYSAEEEVAFVRDYLGPALEKAGLLDRIKLMTWDHNRDFLAERAHASFSDPEAAKYIWGTCFHWYGDHNFEQVQYVHDLWPDKGLVFSEGCQEGGPHLGSWDLGERYALNIINDLNRWTQAWVDWNIVLDETGGPNHVGNLCSAPIIADTQNDKLLFQSSYYYMGHFSRFIQPGAKRILCATTRDDLQATAFINPDGTTATVVLNLNRDPYEFLLVLNGKSTKVTLPSRSIATFTAETTQA